VIGNKIIEQISTFNFLGLNISYCLKEDINMKLRKYQSYVWNNKKNTETKNLARHTISIL
jgi:hypothetical protein